MDNQIATKPDEPLQLENAITKQRLAETKTVLNESKIPYQAILEEVTQSIAIISDEGQILYANAKLAELVEIPMEQLVSKNFINFLADDQVEAFKKSLKDQHQQRFSRDIHFRRADNKLLSLHLSISQLSDKEFDHHCIIIIDRSEIVKSELELQQSTKSLEEKKAELVINKELLSASKKTVEKMMDTELLSKISAEKVNKELLNEIKARSSVELELKRSLEITNQIIAKSLDSIKILDAEGELLLMSEGGQKIMDIQDLSTYLNKPWLNFWKGPEKEKALKALTTAQNGGIGKFEGFRATEKGNPKWWEVAISPIKDEHGKIFQLLVITRDITQRINYEEALSKSESNLRAIFENSLEGFLLLDKNHTVLEINSAMEKIILKIENIHLQKNKNILIDIPKENQKVFLERFQAVVNGEKFIFEKEYSKNEDKKIWIESKLYPIIDLDQSIIGVCIAMTDVSERKKSELTIIQVKELYENLVDHSNGPIIIWDPAFKITRFNHAFEMITGISESEVMGKTIQQVFAGKTNPTNIEQILQNLNGKYSQPIEIEITHTDKTIKTLLWTNTQLLDEDGKTLLSSIGQALDITERKQKELALKESEQLYRTLFENMLNGFALCRLIIENGKPVDYIYLTVNKAFEAQTGLKNVVGKKVSEAIPGIHEKDPKVLETFSRVVMTGQPDKSELYVSTLNAWFFVSSYKTMPNHFVIIFDSITERKTAETKLIESEARLKLSLESNQTGVWELNLEDNNILRTPTHDKIFGYETLLPKFTLETFTEHLLPADRSWVNKIVKDAIEAKREFKMEARIRRADGAIRWIFARGTPKLNSEGKVDRLLGIVQDITERKLNDEALAKTENNLRSLFENTQTGYLLMDTNFTIVEFNKLMEKYFTIADNKILKKNENILNNLINERQESFGKSLKEVLNGSKLNYEISFSLPDGALLWLDSRLYPVTNPEGKVMGACMSYEDVTKRKLDEQKIQELNKTLDKKVLERTAQYESLNKELEAFTFSVSHDLRAPLRAVNSYAQILEEEQNDKLNEDGQLMLKNIKNNGQKMGRLIDDLLAFSRLGRQEIKKVQVNMNELASTALEELNRLFPNHAAIQLSPLPDVEGDYTLLYQVMLNLVGNAIKYSSKKEKPVIAIYAEQKEGKTIFTIKDNGAGFDMRFADKLFGVFQRLHSEQEFEGNGVGLAIVQRIINKHGGKIWGEGKENEGASFYFTLN
jgi:PAS domain S-box-containing protein